jgi:hypothetical protein
MSYLIQNMLWANYTLRLTMRLRAIFLLQHYSQLYSLILFSIRGLAFISTFTLNQKFWIKVGTHLFSRLIEVVYLPLNYLNHALIGQNFDKAAHYTYLTKTYQTLMNSIHFTEIYSLNHYLYSASTPLILIVNNSRFTTYIVNHLLLYWINVWIQWPKFYGVSTSFMCNPRWVQLIYFSNTFYFQVYNV